MDYYRPVPSPTHPQPQVPNDPGNVATKAVTAHNTQDAVTPLARTHPAVHPPPHVRRPSPIRRPRAPLASCRGDPPTAAIYDYYQLRPPPPTPNPRLPRIAPPRPRRDRSRRRLPPPASSSAMAPSLLGVSSLSSSSLSLRVFAAQTKDVTGLVCWFVCLFLPLVQGFTKSLAMTVLSEIGDKTFFAAAVRLLFPPCSLDPVRSACLRRVWMRARGVRRYASLGCRCAVISPFSLFFSCWNAAMCGSWLVSWW